MINNIYNENEINDNGDNSDTGSWILQGSDDDMWQ